MAKKKSRHYPVVRGSRLSSAVENTALRVLQVDQELSKLNRRLMRMGRYYEVKIDIDNDATGQYEVYALRDDWAVQKGFGMAFQVYLNNTADERELMAKNQLARWADFRVHPGVTGNQLLATLHDATMAPQPMLAGEFALADVADADGTVRQFTWSPTPTATQYSILNEYNKAGDQQVSPDNFAGVGPYETVDDRLDDETFAHLEQDGNNPPYDVNEVSQDRPWVKVAQLGNTAGTQKLSTGFFTAPCGIVVIVGSGLDWSSSNITFEAKKGDYKGVHAPAMVETMTVNRKRKVVK